MNGEPLIICSNEYHEHLREEERRKMRSGFSYWCERVLIFYGMLCVPALLLYLFT